MRTKALSSESRKRDLRPGLWKVVDVWRAEIRLRGLRPGERGEERSWSNSFGYNQSTVEVHQMASSKHITSPSLTLKGHSDFCVDKGLEIKWEQWIMSWQCVVDPDTRGCFQQTFFTEMVSLNHRSFVSPLWGWCFIMHEKQVMMIVFQNLWGGPYPCAKWA